MKRLVFLACLSLPLFAPRPAAAHLMQPQAATVNVVDRGVFSVVSIPASALHGVDDDGDGQVSLKELTAHRGELTRDLAERWRVSEGGEEARVVTLDLVLQPDDDAPTDRATHVVMLHHATLSHPAREVSLETDLFGGGARERSLTVTATRRDRSEQAVLSAPHGEHSFFGPQAELTPQSSPRHLGLDVAALLLLATVTLWLTRKRAPGALAPHAP
jgi:hypothetical protein